MTIILTAGQGWRYIQKSSPEGLGQQWPHLVNVPVKNTDTERERGGGCENCRVSPTPTPRCYTLRKE